MKSVVWAIALIFYLIPVAVLAEVERSRASVRLNMISIATLTANHHEAIKQLWVNPYVAESSSSASIATMVTANREQPLIDMVDVIELPLHDAIAACDAGELNMLPVSMLGSEARPQDGSYVANSVQPCSIGHSMSTTMIVFDASRFEEVPSVLGDFFDLENFPGKRVLVRQPQAIAEWALLVAGVPRADIYHALSADWAWSKIETVLADISDDIIWVDSNDEALDLLSRGTALFGAVSSVDLLRSVASADPGVEGFNSFLANYDVVWDGTIAHMHMWAVPKMANAESAMDFIQYAIDPAVNIYASTALGLMPTSRDQIWQIDDRYSRAMPMGGEIRQLVFGNNRWWREQGQSISDQFYRYLGRISDSPPQLLKTVSSDGASYNVDYSVSID